MIDPKKVIDAVRSHPLLGHGSCSALDECFDDEELMDEFYRWYDILVEDSICTFSDEMILDLFIGHQLEMERIHDEVMTDRWASMYNS